MTDQIGPTITRSCHGCKLLKTDRHVDTEADEEYFESYCTHPDGPRRQVRPADTPPECPVLNHAMITMARQMAKAEVEAITAIMLDEQDRRRRAEQELKTKTGAP